MPQKSSSEAARNWISVNRTTLSLLTIIPDCFANNCTTYCIMVSKGTAILGTLFEVFSSLLFSRCTLLLILDLKGKSKLFYSRKKKKFLVGNLIHERDRQVNEFSYIVFVVCLQ